MIGIYGNRILIKPTPIEDTYTSKDGSVVLAVEYGTKKQRMEAAQTDGIIIAMGADAFKEFGDDTPKLGDHVLHGKFQGVGVIDPETNEKLTVLVDEDVICIIKGDK